MGTVSPTSSGLCSARVTHLSPAPSPGAASLGLGTFRPLCAPTASATAKPQGEALPVPRFEHSREVAETSSSETSFFSDEIQIQTHRQEICGPSSICAPWLNSANRASTEKHRDVFFLLKTMKELISSFSNIPVSFWQCSEVDHSLAGSKRSLLAFHFVI